MCLYSVFPSCSTFPSLFVHAFHSTGSYWEPTCQTKLGTHSSFSASSISHAGACWPKCASGAAATVVVVGTSLNSGFSLPAALDDSFSETNDLCALHIKECIEQQHTQIRNKQKTKQDLSDVIVEHFFLRVRGGHAVTK